MQALRKVRCLADLLVPQKEPWERSDRRNRDPQICRNQNERTPGQNCPDSPNAVGAMHVCHAVLKVSVTAAINYFLITFASRSEWIGAVDHKLAARIMAERFQTALQFSSTIPTLKRKENKNNE